MNKSDVFTLLDYHKWANRQVWRCVESLNDEQFTQAHHYSAGSVHNQMFHLMSGDNWLAQYILHGRFPAPDDPAAPQQADYPDRASLRARWDDVEQELTGVVAALSDEQWNEKLMLPSGNDDTFATTLGELFVAHVNHGTNHRAQVLALINELGGQTVEQGFYFYLLQR